MIDPTQRTARRASGPVDSSPAEGSTSPDSGPRGSASSQGRVRTLLRLTGAALIAAGLLAAGAAWWDEWGTGIQTAAAQDELETYFAAAMTAPRVTSPETTAAPAVSPAPTSYDTPGPPAPDTRVEPADGDTEVAVADETIVPVLLEEGDVLGRMEIPAINVDWMTVEGVRDQDIDVGPGHFPGTPMPGQQGNSAFAGHRTTHGAPFNRIDELVPGDQIVVTTLEGRFVYEVFQQQIVDDTDVWVIETGDPDVAVLTLVSCHPKRSTAQRIVVNAILIGS